MSADRYHNIYQRLRSRIEKGSLPLGKRLSEVRLAADFDMSRNTLRRATGLLERHGFIQKINGSGIFVADFKTRRRKILLLATPANRKTVGLTIGNALAEAARDFNMELIARETSDFFALSQAESAKLRDENTFSGILLVGSLQRANEQRTVRLHSLRLPVILLSAYPGDRAATGFATVGIDYRASLAMAVAAISRAKHHKIITIGGNPDGLRGYSLEEYRQLLEWSGINSERQYYLPCSWEGVGGAIRKLHPLPARPDAPSAALCYSHGHAEQTVRTLKEIGIHIPVVELFPEPGDVFESAAVADYSEMARKSVELLEQSENWFLPGRQKIAPLHVMIRPRFVGTVPPPFKPKG